MIEHLHKLGVTSIELLPIHSFVDERHLLEHGLKNYWGYNSISFFAPERRYAADNVQNAFRSTVSELHNAGIEVILDVVYNHTAEGNHLGPTLCYRGIDNTAYYWLIPETPRFYENYTGTGNALKLAHPRVLQMVMDLLRCWVEVFHVDGFRFDLASTLGRAPAFDPHSAFFAAVRQDPVLANVKLIAEPWDIGSGGYRVGGFPPGWSEWNDVYRKTLRRYWRGDANLLGELASALTGSAQQFRHDGRGPHASINHVTVHDGFTLADLVSYEHKHNEANGEDNRDGSDDNNSLNCGVEGPTDDLAILQKRRLLRRNQLASLLLAQGVPLLLAGDEAGNTQGGNNNAYCQDNEIGWVNWSGLGNDDDMTEFIGGLSRLRQRFAQLRSRHWLEGRKADGSHDVLWLRPDAVEMKEEDWNFPEGRFLAYVLAAAGEDGEPLFVVFNAAADGIEVTLPAWLNVTRWSRVLDTAQNSVLVETTTEPPGESSRRPPPRSWRLRASHDRGRQCAFLELHVGTFSEPGALTSGTARRDHALSGDRSSLGSIRSRRGKRGVTWNCPTRRTWRITICRSLSPAKSPAPMSILAPAIRSRTTFRSGSTSAAGKASRSSRSPSLRACTRGCGRATSWCEA